jgi:PKD repeat protein
MIGTFIDNGGAHPAASYSATAIIGGVSVPLSVSQMGTSNSYKLVNTASFAVGSAGVSNYSINVTSTFGSTADTVGSLTLTDAPLTVGAIPPNLLTVAGTPNNGVFLMRFTDPALGAAGQFSAVIDWGDGSPNSMGTITGPVAGVYSVSGSHTYATARILPYNIQIRVASPGGSTALGTNTATVLAAVIFGGTSIPIVGTQGAPLTNVPVATFVDANPSATAAQFIATVNWGGGPTPGVVTRLGSVPGGGSLFAISGSYLFASKGTFPVTVIVADVASPLATTTINTTANINQTPISVNVLPQAVTAGVAIPAGTLIGTFTNAGGPLAAGAYTATVDWGDGTAPDVLNVFPDLGGGTFGILDGHTYALPGVYAIHITVDNADPATGVGGSIAYVANSAVDGGSIAPAPGAPLQAVEGQPLVNVPIATFTTTNLAAVGCEFLVMIDWGDGSPQSLGTVTPVAGSPGEFLISGNHTYTEESTPFGTYNVTVIISDTFGGVASSVSVVATAVTLTLPVVDAPLTPGVGLDLNGSENQPLTGVLVATFTDANPFATAADFTATVVWGDASPMDTDLEVRLIGGSPAGAIFGVYGTHTYTSTGLFATATTVQDKGGSAIAVTPIAGTVTISDSPILVHVLPISAPYNVPTAPGVVATFTDLGGPDLLADYTATIDWGDGSPTDVGTLTDLGGGTFAVNGPAHTYDTPGTYIVTVTVVDNDPATGIGANVALVATPSFGDMIGAGEIEAGLPPLDAAVEGTPLVDIPLASFVYSDPTFPAESFNAVIYWGDGSPATAGTVVPDPVLGYVVLGSHTYLEETGLNPSPITVIVTDPFGNQVYGGTTILVADAALSNGSILPVVGGQHQPLSSVPIAMFTDANPFADAADFTGSVSWGDGGPADTNLQFVLVGGNAAGSIFAVYGSHTYASSGSFTLGVIVNDKGGSSLAINAGPQAVIAQSPISVNVLPLQAVNGTPTTPGVIATFTDSGTSDPIGNYSAVIDWGDGSPTSMGTLAALGGVGGGFSVSAPAHTYLNGPGTYVLTVTVTNSAAPVAMGIGGNLAIVASSTITAVPPAGGPITGAVEGASLTNVTVAAFTDTNIAGLPSDNTATILWGDGTPATAGTIVPDPAFPPGTGHYLVRGTHTYTEDSSVPLTVSVRIVDKFGQVVSGGTLVAGVADAPLSNGMGLPITGSQHQPLVDVPVATFVDANPFATAADFTASILWGDGGLPDTNTQVRLIGGSPAGAIFAVYGSHTYGSVGTFTAGVNVQDKGGSSIAVSPAAANVTITQSPISVSVLPLTASQGIPAAAGAIVATFIDAAGPGSPIGNYSAVIDWGDGTPTSMGTIGDLGGGGYSVTAPAGGHVYTSPGVHVLTVTVVDSDPATGIGGNLVVVNAATLTITAAAVPIATVEGTPLTNVTVATFTSSNPAAPIGSFLATIDWGDGSPQSSGAISQPGGPGTQFTVTGNHTYADEGSYSVTVYIKDVNGTTVSVTETATVLDATLVNPVGIPITVGVADPLVNVPLGTFADNNPLATAADFTATINWGDGSPTSLGFVSLIGGNNTQAFFKVSGSHSYATSGPKVVVITVVDAGGSSTVITTTVTVVASPMSVNVNPIVATEGLPTPNNLLIATFTTGNSGEPASNFSAVIDWGDGTTSGPAGVSIVQSGGSYNVYAPAHTYAEEGIYIVQVTVSDVANPGFPVTGANLAFVKDAALTGINGGPFTVNEGQALNAAPLVTFTDANPMAPISDFTATIHWGDGTTTSGTITQPGGPGTPFWVNGTHVYMNQGTYVASVHIEDEGGSQANAQATVNVLAAPIILIPRPTPVTGFENVSLNGVEVATFTTSNATATADRFLATIVWGDGTPNSAGIITKDVSGIYHVTADHVFARSGAYSIVVTVSNADGSGPVSVTSQATISDMALNLNAVPVQGTEGLALPNTQNAVNGTVVATFYDLGLAPLASFNATIDWGNGQVTPGVIVADGPNFSVIAPVGPAILYMEEGSYVLRVTVTGPNPLNPGGFSTAYAVGTVTIADAKLTADPAQPIVNAMQGSPFVGVQVAKFTDGNPFAPVSDFSATIDWGDGTPMSAGRVIQPGGVGTAFFVVGNHTYANPTTPPATPYTVRVTINDEGGSSLVTTTTANVTASTITGTPTTIKGTEGMPIINAVVGYFTDSGTPGPLSSYAAMINWGDGSPATPGFIVPVGGNQFAVQGTHTYLEENLPIGTVYTVTVTVSHNGLPAATILSSASIVDAPLTGVALPIYGAVEGAQYKGAVAFFTDADPNGNVADYTATINWGDGTSSTGSIVASGGGFLVKATDPISGLGHVYAEEGTYTFNVVIQDVGGSEVQVFGTAIVADAPLTATGLIISTPIYPAFNGVVATFTDADPAGVVSDYTATINWGDGVTTQATFIDIGPGGEFQVHGTHLFDRIGSYAATITIKDNGGATATAVSMITVTDLPIVVGADKIITGIEGKPLTAQVATFTYANPNAVFADFTTTINWGDGTSSAGILGQRADGTFTVTGTHTYVEESAPGAPYNITVDIKNYGGSVATAKATAVIADAPLSSQGTTINAVEGLPATNVTVATFTDSNPLSEIADFTATINWGDGTPASAGVIHIFGMTPAGVTYTVTGTHTYAEEGNFQTQVTISDVGGSQTIAVGQAIVADAPLSPGAVQPPINVTEGLSFTLPIVSFIDANPNAPISDFAADIDWGDGTPHSSGTISQPGGVGTPFLVTGSHNYINPFVNGGTGRFPVLVTVLDKGGSSVQVTNQANVQPLPFPLTGYLNPSSDSGLSQFDAVTNVNQPNFFGHSQPYAYIQLFAIREGSNQKINIGSGQADGSGAWNITTIVLPDGRYSIVADAINRSGVHANTQQILPNAGQGMLVVDTVAPKITNVDFNRIYGQITVTFQDNLSGMDLASISDAANYSLTRPGTRPGAFLVNVISVTGGSGTGPVTATLSINNGRQIRGGSYTLTVRGVGNSPVQDVAGNDLDGVFYGYYPSGNGNAGSNFVAILDAIHHRIYAPRTVVGHASPIKPPGRPATGRILKGNADPNTRAGTPGIFHLNPQQLRARQVRAAAIAGMAKRRSLFHH